MIQVYGRRDSSNAAKVFWALDELSAPYALVERGGRFGGTKTPEYLALNPHSKVPTLVDGDVVAWESNAVLRYLGNRYAKGPIWPADAAGRAAIDRWMDWSATTLVPALGKVRTAMKAPGDADAVAAALTAAGAHFMLLDRIIADGGHIAGEAFTLADIAAGPAVHRWFLIDAGMRPDLPGLAAYRERLAARPFFKTNIADALT